MFMIKNMTKEVLKNKTFLVLLFVMTICTSFIFFFIRFSIDANLTGLEALASLTQNQQNYMRALNSNRSLALSMLFTIAGVTAAIFALFYLRFYISAKKQIGILKSLGYKNTDFQIYFSVSAIIFSVFGLLLGMLLGYFASSVHIAANMASYGVTGLVKGVSTIGIVLGIGFPLLLFGVTMFLCGFLLYKKDIAELIGTSGAQNLKQSKMLKFADVCVKKLPIKKKAPVRIALRRPLSILILVLASMVFTVMLVLGWSLTASGNSVYKSQTEGHNYQYESRFNEIKTQRAGGNAIYYLAFHSRLLRDGDSIEQTAMGIDFNEEIYDLQNKKGEKLSVLTENHCYIGEELFHMYNVGIGDEMILQIGEKRIEVKVRDVAYNVRLKTILFGRSFIAEQLRYAEDSFNGAFSIDHLYPNADSVIDGKTRADTLKRSNVSSQVSAVVNQSIGVLSGIILIFLALFITLQDSVRDMMILRNLGYGSREIKKLLINIFLPILLIAFVITAFPAVQIAKAMQFSLSLQTGDYMPFSTNIFVIIIGLIAVAAIYFAVQAIYGLILKRILKKKSILQYTNEL